jgi:hypothetical protein
LASFGTLLSAPAPPPSANPGPSQPSPLAG